MTSYASTTTKQWTKSCLKSIPRSWVWHQTMQSCSPIIWTWIWKSEMAKSILTCLINVTHLISQSWTSLTYPETFHRNRATEFLCHNWFVMQDVARISQTFRKELGYWPIDWCVSTLWKSSWKEPLWSLLNLIMSFYSNTVFMFAMHVFKYINYGYICLFVCVLFEMVLGLYINGSWAVPRSPTCWGVSLYKISLYLRLNI